MFSIVLEDFTLMTKVFPNFTGNLQKFSLCRGNSFFRSNHADIARSLITMVAYNIGYLACLVGRIHGVTRLTLLAVFCFYHSFFYTFFLFPLFDSL
jgi:pantothenate kinase